MEFYNDGCYYLNIEKNLNEDEIVFSNLSKGYESRESKIIKGWLIVKQKPQTEEDIQKLKVKNNKIINNTNIGCIYDGLIDSDMKRYKKLLTDTEIKIIRFRDV